MNIYSLRHKKNFFFNNITQKIQIKNRYEREKNDLGTGTLQDIFYNFA